MDVQIGNPYFSARPLPSRVVHGLRRSTHIDLLYAPSPQCLDLTDFRPAFKEVGDGLAYVWRGTFADEQAFDLHADSDRNPYQEQPDSDAAKCAEGGIVSVAARARMDRPKATARLGSAAVPASRRRRLTTTAAFDVPFIARPVIA